MLRKLAIWLLLIPLPLNGLWLMCREGAPEPPKQAEASANDNTNLFEAVAAVDTNLKAGSNCERECAFKSNSNDGSFCLISGGSKTSLTIMIFGVAVLLPAVQLRPLAAARRTVTELPDFYLSPAADHSTPPPRA